MNCFRHPLRPAVGVLRVPCAPGGALPVCAEYKDPKNLRATFEAYQSTHSSAIAVQKEKERQRAKLN